MKHLLLALATVLLVSCGGGDPAPEADITPTPQADAAASAPTLEPYITDQLFVYAEKEYKDLFPGGSVNLFLGPWTYRYYPAVGYYVGIITTPLIGYTLGDVYVMGNEFGNEPLNVGPVTRFFTPRRPFSISSAAIYVTDGQEGQTFALRGVSLKDITALKLADKHVQVVEHTEDMLSFKLPPKTNNTGSLPPCGQLIATTSSSRHMVGAYASERACALSMGTIEVAQSFVEPSTNQTIDLIPYKRTVVRTLLTTRPDYRPVPAEVRVMVNGQITHTVAMTPPSAPSETLDDASAYAAAIPGEYVLPGATFIVAASPQWQSGKPVERSVTPRYDNTSDMDIVIIPIIDASGKEPKIEPLDVIAKSMYSRLPFDEKTTKVRMGVPMTLSYKLDTYENISLALMDLMQHRSRHYKSGERSIYYGFWVWQGTGVVGIAYVNSSVGMGVESSIDRVMAHEVGHVLGLWHAPCGSVASPDNSFPYEGGGIGPIKPFDVYKLYTIWYPNMTDIMGYCSSDRFSDYNFKKIQETIDTRRRLAGLPTAVATVPGLFNVYLISGTKVTKLREGVTVPEGAKRQLDSYIMELSHDDIHVFVPAEMAETKVTHAGVTHSIVQAVKR